MLSRTSLPRSTRRCCSALCPAQDPTEKVYDRLTRELAMEARAAQPGDRTKTAEELADLERKRLEALER